MAAINFPTATSNGQTFTADTGVIYTYIGTPPNGFWSGTFGTTGLATLDGRFVALNDGNSIQTMQTQGLKFNNGTADTILLDGVNGKVGIGTTSPGVLLELKAADPYIRLTDTTATSGYSQVMGTHQGALVLSADTSNSVGSSHLRFDVDASERMRIDSSGNVGIGVASSAYELQVHASSGSSTIHITNSTVGSTSSDGARITASSSGILYIDNNENAATVFDTNATERMRIDSSGRLLVGTTAGAYKLVVSGGVATTGIVASILNPVSGGNSKIHFSDNATYNWTAGTVGNAFAITPTEASTTAGTPALFINSSGNVGIGDTLTNSFKFKVRNSAGELARFTDGVAQTLDIRTASGGIQIRNANNGFISLCGMSGASTIERMRIDSSGNVGIGTTSPLRTLHVSTSGSGIQEVQWLNNAQAVGADVGSALAFTGTTANNGLARISGCFEGAATTNGGYLRFDTRVPTSGAFSEAMRIDSSGSVLINHTQNASPDGYYSKLQLCDTSYQGSSALLRRDQNNASGPTLILAKSRSSSKGGNAIVQNGDDCGSIRWYANDGVDQSNEVCRIRGILDGTPGSNDTPGALLFFTTPDGSIASAERMRIDSSGNVQIGNNTNSAHTNRLLSVGKTNRSATYIEVRTSTSGDGGLLFSDGTGSGNEGYRGTVEYSHSIDKMFFKTAGSNRLEINSSGNVQISTGIIALNLNDTFTLNGKTQPYNGFNLSGSQTSPAAMHAFWGLVFGTESSERARISKEGRIYMGTTADPVGPSAARLHAKGTGGNAIVATVDTTAYTAFASSTTSGGYAMWMYNTSTSQNVGSIYVGHAGVTYNTSSDYRLKENVVDLTAAIPRLKTLPVHRFNFLADKETTVDGFLAHEAQLVVPESVTGTHNEVDGDGNPVMQGIDQAKLVPLLTAALQEAIGRIETLETEVAALKGG